MPELPAGRSSAGCEVGAARVSARSALTVLSVGHVTLDNAVVGVAVGAAVGMAVAGADVPEELDADELAAAGELPHATSVAANTTGTTAARRRGVRMVRATSLQARRALQERVDARPIAARSQVPTANACVAGAFAVLRRLAPRPCRGRVRSTRWRRVDGMSW